MNILRSKFTLEKMLGTGGFGYIYVASDAKKTKSVMKVEPQDNGPLFSEMHFYQRVGKTDVVARWEKDRKLPYLGIPTMSGFGIHEQGGTKYRMLEALEFLHDHEYVHADVKSANILLDGKRVFLADFGLARKYTLNGKIWLGGRWGGVGRVEPVSKTSAPKSTPEVVNQTQSVVAPRRKSPRVVQQKVVLSSDDSEPELLPMPSKKAKKAPVKKGGKMATKAGLKPPLPLNTAIVNPTQKTSFTLEKMLGTGGFGYIYVASDAKKTKSVMKVEPQDNGPLFSEMHFYQRVGKTDVVARWEKDRKLPYLGIPTMSGFGIHEQGGVKYRYLVIPFYTEGDLLKRFEEQDRQFSPQTTLLLTIRMLEALEFLHDHEYVHADVKSANILLDGKRVFLADFGLARKYTVNGVHKVYKEEPGKAHDGTKEYTSVDAHRGVQPARRGDLQILGYCAVEWLGGALPWLSIGTLNGIRSEKIK
eukprot:sb/3464339/